MDLLDCPFLAELNSTVRVKLQHLLQRFICRHLETAEVHTSMGSFNSCTYLRDKIIWPCMHLDCGLASHCLKQLL